MGNRKIDRKIFGRTIQWARAAMAVLALFVLLTGGCGNALLNLPGGDEQEVDTGLRITVPRFSPWLLEYLAGSGGTGTEAAVASRSLGESASRAFSIVDSVALTVRDSLNAVVASETVTHADYFFDDGSGFTLSIEVPVGTGYTLHVDIYNHAVSTEDPVVSGTSASFSVTEGAITGVPVTCVPVTPHAITLGAAANSYTQTSTLYDSGTSTYTFGGETWFSFTSPANGAVMFTIDIPVDAQQAAVALFSDEGVIDPRHMRPAFEDGSLFFTGLDPDSQYYAVVLLFGNGTAQSFTLSASAANTISGNITLPGYTSTTGFPFSQYLFLVPDFLANMNESNMINYIVPIGVPAVDAGNLEWTYVIGYDGDETAVLAAGFVNDFNSWPAEGDFVGAYDGNTGTPMDFVAGTGIEPYHFTGDVTGIDFNLQLIEGEPDLEDTRVGVTVNFEYTGAPSTHGGGEVKGVLTYEDGGAAFAGQASWEGTSGTMTFDDYLVPIGEEVYLQLYYDLDESFSISAGDPVYRHHTPISVDGGSATLTFDDTATCSASCPDAAGGWLTSSSWGDMVVTLTEDAFAIMRRTDTGSPSYGDVASVNNYGTITTVNNTEGYAIGQWTYA